MGLRMGDHLHAPTTATTATTVASGPMTTTTSSSPDTDTLQHLFDQKKKIEAELSALCSVLDSVGIPFSADLFSFHRFHLLFYPPDILSQREAIGSKEKEEKEKKRYISLHHSFHPIISLRVLVAFP